MDTPGTIRPEPVEGLSSLYGDEEGVGFDKLSPNGFSFLAGVR
jgi:hypothetical protein